MLEISLGTFVFFTDNKENVPEDLHAQTEESKHREKQAQDAVPSDQRPDNNTKSRYDLVLIRFHTSYSN